MPPQFDMCVEKGGKVKTLKLKGDKYMHICYMDGKAYSGEVKMKKMMGEKVDIKKQGMK